MHQLTIKEKLMPEQNQILLERTKKEWNVYWGKMRLPSLLFCRGNNSVFPTVSFSCESPLLTLGSHSQHFRPSNVGSASPQFVQFFWESLAGCSVTYS